MKYKLIKTSNFWIAGISVRTNNNNGQALKDIGNLWEKWFSLSIADLIPNKVSNNIYCVYTDYVSDFQDDYTTILGCIVSSSENIPEELMIKEIIESEYQEYIYSGKIPDCVGDTWNYIWNNNIKRAYKADFDVYTSEISADGNPVVKTYISI